MSLRRNDVLATCDVLPSVPTTSVCSILSGLFIGIFTVVCSTGARLECVVLKGAMVSLLGSGPGCLCMVFSTWSVLGLLSSIIISFSVIRIGYLGGFDFL